MEIKRLRTLVKEFKTISDINPSFMKDISTSKRDPKIRPSDILVKHNKPAKYDDKSFRSANMVSTSFQCKILKSITKFKEYIRTWFGPSCKCNIYRMI